MIATATVILLVLSIGTRQGMGIQENTTTGRPSDCQYLIQQGKSYEGHYVVYPEVSSPNKAIMVYCSQDDGMKALPADTEPARNCLDLLKGGMIYSGSGVIYPYLEHPTDPVLVYCDQETDGGGWTVIQNRFDGSVDFYRSWREYSEGFGNIQEEHYLGNAIIAALTGQSSNELWVDLKDWDNVQVYAHYQIFYIDARYNYQLQVAIYEGTAGDALTTVGQAFSTFDADHDDVNYQCAETHHGAWWYEQCSLSNLNGRYYPSANTHDTYEGMYWDGSRGVDSLKTSKMMIRPTSGVASQTEELHDAHEDMKN